ncbi:hypothetical protein H310_10469 [Aphanomyces invadans]|uniref:FAD dependent oxidoreductase domain-containing protein n=1 Tax=Aphanomyces invadans TaxID=157072 RepID=A0A024TQL6_9STRA|nr:hypothetical protein H310_10469 [Aphanomyces invadans]ETV96304.1 hypothetical protein H310_10469 [Aphanomyces invadans]|eukprot:XP_008875096.1 hypothetical protein H310_10469 [Aphanomyces invadans]
MKIVIVGAGIVGLSTALALLEHGYDDVTIVAENLNDTTSHTAGAVWRPVFAGATSDRTMDHWSHETMLWLRQLTERHGPTVVGIQRTPGIELSDSPPEAHPYWAHSVEDFRLLTRDEALQHPPHDKEFGIAYTSVMIHPGILMQWMAKQIKSRGGKFETRFVASLDELDGDVVINCTGLGARKLVGDASVYPVRGQVIKVFNPNIKRFVCVESYGQYTYILPRPGGEVIVGGTADIGNWNTANNDADIAAIMDRAVAVMPEIKGSNVLYAKAGLRPSATRGTRVELNPKRTSKHKAWVIHNYGHGGSGHTIHRGCASAVVNIVRSYTSKL